MIGHLKRDDVREFMPQGAAPVEGVGLACRRRIHHEQLPKAHAQCADSRQSERPHGEIGVVRIHFKCDRTLRFEFIFFAERLVCLLQKLSHVRSQDGAFFLVKFDLEVGNLIPVKVDEAVQKLQRVMGQNVERISLGRLFQSGRAFLLLADPQQIDPEHAHGIPVSRIQTKRLAREIHSLFVKAQ